MPYPSLLKDIDKMSPEAQAAMKASYSKISDAANRLGIDPYQYVEREEMLRDKEEKDRKRAMNPNVSKFMTDKEKDNALNAYKYRRFREMGIGSVEGDLI
jgi:hypothetical protein